MKAIIHKEEDGTFWAEVPSLPGCYSQGDTMAELLVNLREAAQGCLEVMRAEGRTPEPEVEVTELAV
jgi:predicted RNase H-like HicB family nuclease